MAAASYSSFAYHLPLGLLKPFPQRLSGESRIGGIHAGVERILTRNDNWLCGAALYQIYPLSFQDSDGDGYGDLEGIVRHLGYVASLGVDGIWIAPFYPSPWRDFGYDVADYKAVDPRLGTLDMFDQVLAE